MLMNRPGVLVLSEDANDYPHLLDDLVRSGTVVRTATTATAARAVWSGEPVVLGQPDLVAAVIGDLGGVRWVQSTWAGVTPLLTQGRRDFQLTAVKDIFGPQMTEYVLGYLLAHELRLLQRHRHQQQREWWPAPSGALQGKTLGIMGTGSIGACIARTAASLGLRVVGFSRGGEPCAGFERVFAAGRLVDFLAEPDYLCCVLPDTPATTNLLDEAAFRAMRRGSYLLNVGRGNLIDEAALLDALGSGRIAGAVLDVFKEEPLPPESPLWRAPNLIVTAHMAADSRPRDVARIFIGNYNRFVAGRPLRFLVDFERGY
jgi:phosphoglycerate dehydrogenase-like enzyme